jgi:hypothetical protein
MVFRGFLNIEPKPAHSISAKRRGRRNYPGPRFSSKRQLLVVGGDVPSVTSAQLPVFLLPDTDRSYVPISSLRLILDVSGTLRE